VKSGETLGKIAKQYYEDAIEFDNSNLTEEEQFQTLLGLAEKTIRDNT
jgi:hypothetical protein